MSLIPVVENPKRHRRRSARGRRGKSRSRRALTPKQLRAGFGGKSHMKTFVGMVSNRRRHNPSRRRRNPALATLQTLAGNPRRHHRRHRNPAFGFFGVNLPTVASISAGLIGVQVVPGLIRKYVWGGLPSTGIGRSAVQLGTGLALGYVTKMVTKSSQRSMEVVGGALASVVLGLWTDQIAPKLGLAGLGSEYATPAEIQAIIGSGRAGMYETYHHDEGAGIYR